MRSWLAVLILAVGCGGGDDACPVTPDAAPPVDGAPIDPLCAGAQCGGDLTGTWEVVASCATGTGDASYLNCADGTLHYREFMVRGTFTFAADGTVTTDADEHFLGDAYLPLSCYAGFDCAGLEALAGANGIVATCEDRGPVDPDTCAVVADACACTIGLDDPSVMLQGTVVADPAGTLTLTLGNETIEGEFCVDGDQLWIHGVRFGGVDYEYRFQRAP